MNSIHTSLKVLALSSLFCVNVANTGMIDKGQEKFGELTAEAVFRAACNKIEEQFSKKSSLEKLKARQEKINSLDESITFWEGVQAQAQNRFDSHTTTHLCNPSCKKHKALADACKKATSKVSVLTDKWLKNIKKS